MNRRKIVAGNWKMNTDLHEALSLASAIRDNSKSITGVEKIIFPPFTFLSALNEVTKDEKSLAIGGQNCSEHEKGAYTGETAASMLRSVGCEYVLVGHSERRTYFSETSAQLISKIKIALQNNLKIIFCFGEQLSERKSNKHFETVKLQLEEVLTSFPKEEILNLVLAYEPVWAIGTGETATPEQAQEMHAFIRKTLTGIFSKEIADQMPILYGGSCNAQNARDLFACPDVDGGLIGGASLKAEDFCIIMKSFS
ncbi:MAG: triose-phosphate isomerase [Bacteroidia bacterium]|nr:triose-phosphate isomerase [Bacteroidia bacterium]